MKSTDAELLELTAAAEGWPATRGVQYKISD